MKVLVIGRSGQLATALLCASWQAGTQIVAVGRGACDIAARDDVVRTVAAHAPDLVINAAAYNAVDRAETEPDRAFAVNAAGPAHLAFAARARAIPLVHVSTDYVFDGGGGRPWREDDEPRPLGVYGRSKREGECAVLASGATHLILRTSWLFTAHGENFVRTMLRLGAARDALAVVADQIGCPTPAGDLAAFIAGTAPGLAAGTSPVGLYHFAGAPAVSRYEFAQAIFARAGDLVPRPPSLRAITSAAFGAAAPRPAFSALDCRKTERTFAITMPRWQDGLDIVLNQLRSSKAALQADS
jgi:dTDP-4-dehydrorhamnose reductase